MKLVTSAGDIEETWKEGRIASMIGVEGGHSLDSSLAVLRLYHELGVRYVTLTHTCNTPWYGNYFITTQYKKKFFIFF